MPSVGTVQLLQVYEENETGYLLGDQQNHVLLPKEQVDKQLSLGEYINVFIYHDRNNEIVATTNIPSIKMNTYDWAEVVEVIPHLDRKSTRLNSSHVAISYAVFCLKKKKKKIRKKSKTKDHRISKCISR